MRLLLLFTTHIVFFLKLGASAESRLMYAYVYPAPRIDDYFMHYKTWSKGHGFYIRQQPYKECKEVGQVLEDPDDPKCCYLVCDYGPRPRYDVRTGRYELYVRRNKCPLGTRIDDKFASQSKKTNFLRKYKRSPCSKHDLTKVCSVKYYVRKEVSRDGSGRRDITYIPLNDPPESTTPRYKEVYF